jgi:hypothetical protein
MEEETVTITLKEYESLLEDSRWLSCLEAAGVDNWNGYDHASDILSEWDAESDG